MTDNTVKILSSVSNHVGADFLLLILSITLFVAFAVNLFLSIFLVGYGIKKRFWFVFFSVGVSLFGFSMFVKSGYSLFFFAFLMGESLIYVIPLYLIPEKQMTESKNFIKYIDEEIDRNNVFLETPQPINMRNYKRKDIDYTHVKKVIEKLNNVPLSLSDRSEIKILYSNLLKAENGEQDGEIKEKINDGLGQLLKIMAKYNA